MKNKIQLLLIIAFAHSASQAQEIYTIADIQFSTESQTVTTTYAKKTAEERFVYKYSTEQHSGGGKSTFIRLVADDKDLKQKPNSSSIDESASHNFSQSETIVEVQVYPNPLNYQLVITNPSKSALVISFYTLNGDLVAKFEDTKEYLEIPATKLKKGTLVYTLEQNGKLIKTDRITVE